MQVPAMSSVPAGQRSFAAAAIWATVIPCSELALSALVAWVALVALTAFVALVALVAVGTAVPGAKLVAVTEPFSIFAPVTAPFFSCLVPTEFFGSFTAA